MDGGAASVVNSTLRISQIVYEFKAVGEQARDLLASTKHVAKAIETTRTLRRQKSAHLASTEKEWIDSTIEDAERTLNNVAALVEPVRVDMQTKFGKIGLVKRGMFVFRDSPKVLTHQSQLNMTHVSLVNALNILSQRQAQLLPPASPALDRRASYATLPKPPTYEESEFLNRRRGKLKPKPSQVNLVEETLDMANSIVDNGLESQQGSNSASSSTRLSSTELLPVVYIDDGKCLLSEIIECIGDPSSTPVCPNSSAGATAIELEAGPYNTRPRPQTYQAYCPDPNNSFNRPQHPWSSGSQPSTSFYSNDRYSMPAVSASQSNNAPINLNSIPASNGSDTYRGDAELHFPQAPLTPGSLASPQSSNSPSSHPRTSITSLFPTPNGRPCEIVSRPASPKVQQTPPYPNYTPTTPSSYTPSDNHSPPRPDVAIGLGVRLSAISRPSSPGYHRTQSYPGSVYTVATLPQSAGSSGPADQTTAQAPIERSVSHDIGSLSRRRRYEWLEYHAGT